MRDGAEDAERLWLDALQLVTQRISHELKGALNGVSVNLEVVRGRAADGRQPASAVARFADSAAGQLDLVIGMTEALLALGRRVRDPVDVAATLRQLAALLLPVARAKGVVVTLGAEPDGVPSASAVPGAVVRSLLATVFMEVIDGGGGSMQLTGDARAIVLEVVASQALRLDTRLAAAAAVAGVGIGDAGQNFTLTFPVAAPPLAPAETTTHGIA